MLQFIRDRAQSWIAFLIVGMLIVGLSVVAIESFFSPDPTVSVAKVNGENITVNDFQRAYQQQRDRLQQMLGDTDISKFIPDEEAFKKNILKRLENEKMLLQEANGAGLGIGDVLLAQQIRSFDAFQEDGAFKPELYEMWLSQNFMSPGDFEEMLRREVVSQQYRAGIADTVWTTEQELGASAARKEQVRDVGYVKIASSAYIDDIEVSDDEAKEYYDNNPSRFETDEKVSIEYIELSVADLSSDVEIPEGALEEMFEERKSEFGVPEERQTRHILIDAPGGGSEEELAAAKAKAEEVFQKIQSGESFEALVKEYSDDFGSTSEGGDLGFLTREMMMDDAYADAVFALSVGDVSEPVQTKYGFHVIKLEAVKEGESKSFAEVKDQLAADYRQRLAEDAFFEQGEALANLTFENPDSLAIAAEELGLTVQSTPKFSRDMGAGIAMNPEIRDLAFSDEVLVQGVNSEPHELDTNHVVVVRVKEHDPATVRAYDEVKGSILNIVKRERAEAKARDAGKALIADLANAESIEGLAKERSYEWKHLGEVKRSDPASDRAVLNKAFSMSRPTDKPIVGGVALPSGDYAVVVVSAVKEGGMGSDEAQLESAENQRIRYYGMAELNGVVNSLRKDSEVVEYPDNL